MLSEERSGERAAWPFYIVCDVSASMHGKPIDRPDEPTPYEAMLESLHELVDFAEENVQAADLAHLGLLTFADDAEVVLPIRRVRDGISLETLPKGNFTNYEKVFAKLADVVDADIKRLQSSNLTVKRPAVFFITDGWPEVDGRPQPRELWEPPLRKLHALAAPRDRRDVPVAVVALGFEGADVGNLRLIAQAPGVACIAEAGVASPYELMSSLFTAILVSVTKSTAEGDLVFSPPRGMKLCG